MRTARHRLTKTAVLFVAVLSLIAATAAGAGAEPPEHAQNDEAGETAPPEHAQNDEAGETAPPEHAADERSGDNRASADGADEVTICHATSSEENPFVTITVSVNSITPSGHAPHQDGRDIIPPFEGFDGQNWDAEGQAIFDAGCVVDDGGQNEPDDVDDGNDKVTLCHATGSETNPYVVITVSINAVTSEGHSSHQDGRDIIPPFEGFDGRNWDAEGQAIFDAGCVVDDGGDGEVEADVELTSLTAVCVAEDAVIRFVATSTVDADGVLVSLLDGTTTVDTETVDFDAVAGGDGFEAAGEFPYPATVAGALTVSLTVDGDEATGAVPAAPDCDDGTTVLPGPVAPVPGDDDTDVGGDEVVNVPVPDLTPSQPFVPPVAQPVAQPTTVESGPVVLGETVTRGALARTGPDSISVLTLAGVGLLLLGLGLRRAGRRALVG